MSGKYLLVVDGACVASFYSMKKAIYAMHSWVEADNGGESIKVVSVDAFHRDANYRQY